jgi:hypothetical protein
MPVNAIDGDMDREVLEEEETPRRPQKREQTEQSV